ncbi:MAG: 4-hydroxyphenylpyruvate dioxygenase [Candidatus Xenobia bacterium]|jgi:4-hydroxyphenylpyruvate dioxygenase
MPKTASAREKTSTDLSLKAIDHIELWVGNAKQAAYYYVHAFGYDLIAYSGLETGVRDRASYVLSQGKIRLVLSTPLAPEHPMTEHIARHGDGVKRIAIEVDHAAEAYRLATERGAVGVEPPSELEDEHGTYRSASIATYGDTLHTFVQRKDYHGLFAPGYQPRTMKGGGVGLAAVDHIVGNVELGKMDVWVDYYKRILGFSQLVHFDDKDISTEYSALMSKVVHDGKGRIKFPLNEPAEGRRKSQIDEYLEYYRGAGVQHIALLTGDILKTVRKLRERGVEFLRVPSTYYEEVPRRVGPIAESLQSLEELGILVDRDDEGYLLQIFTRPVQDRPTVFFEIIQRKGCQGFGKGNFKALFEAIEREQALRGNL